MTKQTKTELSKAAKAILKQARCNTMTGAHKDRDYRRNKRAESKRLGRHQRARTKKLGKMGPASAVRTISVEGDKKE
jgi:hypothetical protein